MLAYSPQFEQMMADFQEKARFLVVYITEAHSKDEWPVGKTISFCNQPKTLQERIHLANLYKNKFSEMNLKLPNIAVDSISNEFDEMFSAWPIRFFVVQNGKLVFKAQPSKDFYGYDINDLSSWLHANV